jgi:hypothetical protein
MKLIEINKILLINDLNPKSKIDIR